MRNFRTTLPILIFLMAMVFFTACKPKKVITQAPPVPVEAPKETPAPAPAPEADSDRDGIVDSKDNCPNKAGDAANGGCPAPVAAAPSFNYKNILFEFNSSVLKTSSYPILDEISRQMKQHPEMRFNLNGHSSAEGTEKRNMTLSVDRATAVKSYLVSSGINGRMLEAKGFGETVPIAPNTTEAGRELNRRVEIEKIQ